MTTFFTADRRSVAMGETDATALFEPAPDVVADWEVELASAVEAGTFRVARTDLVGVDSDRIATWLDRTLPRDVVTRDARDAVISELLRLVHVTGELTSTSRFRFRIFVAAPDRRCGFHVDTVAPGLPTWGLLRVFNGAGTSYVDAADIVSMARFYQWLHRRDRLVREHGSSTTASDAWVSRHDRDLTFLRDPAAVHLVPARITVAFRHLDARLHWTEHEPSLAWVHSSPMSGGRRLVVNVSAAAEQRPDASS